MKYTLLYLTFGLFCISFIPSRTPPTSKTDFSDYSFQDTNKKRKKDKKIKKKKRLSEVESAGDEDAWIDDSQIEDAANYSEESTDNQDVTTTEEAIYQPSPEEIKARQDSIRKTRRNPRDSVPPAPMSHEELKTALSSKKYQRGELEEYEEMKRRLEELRDLRDKSAWLVKQQRWELDDAALKKSMETAFNIRKSYGILENEIREIEEAKGKAAMHKFRHLVVDNIYDVASRRVNRELLDELKTNLFFAKDAPQILCEGGVGRILGHLKGKIEGAQGCRGYISSLSNSPEFNLIIMQLDDGTRLAVILDKNADSDSHGVLGVF